MTTRVANLASSALSFTTGEVAKLCGISQQTVIRCFDNGTLKGFRVPGSRFRRIPAPVLLAFLRAHAIPTDELLKLCPGLETAPAAEPAA